VASFKGDLGYLGEDIIDTPIQKPRNKELTSDSWVLNLYIQPYGKRI
jgi:hypothetical protein